MSPDFIEPTGLVGGGDALALRELATVFNEVGYKNYKILYVDERELDPRENLILLGGMDTNRLTKEVVELIDPGLLIHDPGPGIKMEEHDSGPPTSLVSAIHGSSHLGKFTRLPITQIMA